MIQVINTGRRIFTAANDFFILYHRYDILMFIVIRLVLFRGKLGEWWSLLDRSTEQIRFVTCSMKYITAINVQRLITSEELQACTEFFVIKQCSQSLQRSGGFQQKNNEAVGKVVDSGRLTQMACSWVFLWNKCDVKCRARAPHVKNEILTPGEKKRIKPQHQKILCEQH